MQLETTFESIGFSFNSEEQLLEIIKQVLPESREIIALEDGTKIAIYQDNKLMLFTAIGKDNELLSFNPHFLGSTVTQLDVEEVILDDEFKEADVIAFRRDEQGEEITVLAFYYPYFHKIQLLNPQKYQVALSTFAREVRFFANKEEFDQHQENFSIETPNEHLNLKLSERYFIPIGMLEEPYIPDIRFAGIIQNIEKHQNRLTKRNFYELSVESVIPLTVLLPEQAISAKVQPGAIVEGTFFVSGEIHGV